MKQLQINVTTNAVILSNLVTQINTGEYKTTLVSFYFTEEWNDKIKKARFGDIEVDVVNDTCIFPMFLKTGTIPIKVYGYDEEVIDGETVKVLVYSPQPALIHIEQGSYDGTSGGSGPTPPPEEDADYLTKARLWNGYSMFFGTLTDVPQNIQDEYDSVDISILTTAQVESEIEKINKMLCDSKIFFTQNIADYAITSLKIDFGAVDTYNIAERAITSDLIDSFAVNTNHINTAAITASKIKNGAVNEDKLAQSVIERLDKNYVHEQTTASDTWAIVHNLNKYPTAVVINSAGEEVIGDIKYDSLNQITIYFKGAFKGKATLN